jgi:SAM-dependent methyltransferase
LSDPAPPFERANRPPPVQRRECCPVCGAEQYVPVSSHAGWDLVRCAGCGLAYLPRIPGDELVTTDLEWTAAFAHDRRQRWLKTPWMRLWTSATMWLRPSREASALRWIHRYAPRGRLLDLGCGNGRLVAAALEAGDDAFGVDVSPVMIRKALRRVPPERVMCGRLADVEGPAGSFDAVVAVSYLEHEPRPAEVARRVHALLRPGGMTFFKVPNYDSRLRWLLGRRWSGYRWPAHVQYFTPTTLGRLLEAAGFEIVGVRANRWGDNFWIAGRKRE